METVEEKIAWKSSVLLGIVVLLMGTVTAAVAPDSTPATECSGNNLLEADGSCVTVAAGDGDTSSTNELQNLSEVLVHGNVANQSIDMSENAVQNINALQDGTGTDTLTFDGSSNVKIPNGNLMKGSSSPEQDIHINDSTAGIVLEDNSGGANTQDRWEVSTNIRANGGNNQWGDFGIWNQEDNAGIVIQNTNGRVGINTTTPDSRLDVDGAADIRGNLDMHQNRITNIGSGSVDFESDGDLNLGSRDLYTNKIFGSSGNLYIEPQTDSDSVVLRSADNTNLLVAHGTSSSSPGDIVIQNGHLNVSGGDIDVEGNKLRDSTGMLTLDGNVEVPNGDLDMGDNDISNVNNISTSGMDGAAPLNLFRNGDFETGYTRHLSSNAHRTTATNFTGNYSIIGGDSDYAQFDGVWKVRDHTTGEFIEGETYTLYMYAKNNHSNSVSYGFAGCGGFGTFNVGGNTDWQLYRTTFTVPENCGHPPDGEGETKFQVRSSETWAGTVFFDNTVLVRGDVKYDSLLPHPMDVVDEGGQLDINENAVQNVNNLQDGTGTDTVTFDGSNNVKVPNGNLEVTIDGEALELNADNNARDGIRVQENGVNKWTLNYGNEDLYWKDSGGTKTLSLDQSNNVQVPNGKVYISGDGQGLQINNGSICVDSDGACSLPEEGGVQLGAEGLRSTDDASAVNIRDTVDMNGNVVDIAAAGQTSGAAGLNETGYVHFKNEETQYVPDDEFTLMMDNSNGPMYYHDGAWRTVLTEYDSMTNTLNVQFNSLTLNNGDLDMGENAIQNVNNLQDGTGTDTMTFDGSNNVHIPNGGLNITPGTSEAFEVRGNAGSRLVVDRGSSTRIWGSNKGDAPAALEVYGDSDAGQNDRVFQVFTVSNPNNHDVSAATPVFTVNHTGDVKVPNGNLEMKSNDINSIDSAFFNGGGDNIAWIGTPTASSGVIDIRDQHNNGDLAQFNVNGPITFRNTVANEDILRMNNSGGSDVEIPNGDLVLSAAGSTAHNDIVNVSTLQNGSTLNVELRDSGKVKIPNGNLAMGGNSIVGVDDFLSTSGDTYLETVGTGSGVVGLWDSWNSQAILKGTPGGSGGSEVKVPNGAVGIDSMAGTLGQGDGERLRLGGSSGDTTFSVQGGHGRYFTAWNAEYDSANSQWETISGGDPHAGIGFVNSNPGLGTTNGNIVLATAPSNPSAGDAITWNEVTMDEDGNVKIKDGWLNITGGDCAEGTNPCEDIAELYNASEPMESGELVMVDQNYSETVAAAERGHRGQLLGVVTTSPALLFEEESQLMGIGNYSMDPQKPGVALVGRVPVKVSLENGPINVGDPITVSSQEGVGMKAETAGMVVGTALEPYTAGSTDDRIMVFVNPHYRVVDDSISQLRQENEQLQQQVQSQEQRIDALTRAVCQTNPSAAMC